MKKILNRINDNLYCSDDGAIRLAREADQRNNIAERWVLRKDSEFICSSQYRNDIADKHNLELSR